MRWVLLGVLALAIAFAGAFGIGRLLPETHVATRTVVLTVPPESLWNAITEYASSAAWREDIASVERLPDRDGRPIWREIGTNGDTLTLETVEAVPPRRLVRRIADPNLPFGGTWTFEIAPERRGSTLQITEIGEVYPPLFRFVSRFLIGQHATIDRYIESLGKRFGQRPEPVPGSS